jgi:enoyl-CoA hydratase/carnithine racemase
LTASEVLIDKDGHVASITLNAPGRLNSLTSEVHQMLGEAWDELAADKAIRAVVFTGAGRAFCAGAEMRMLAELAQPHSQPPMPKFTARQKRFFKPVIAAVNGVCAGAGFHFINDSDIVIASETATFMDTHVAIGQVAALEPVGLLRRIPLERVLRMVILGSAERLDAATAREIGLVSEVVAAEDLLARAHELATIASAGSPATMQASLEAIWDSLDCTLDEAYKRGYELLVEHRMQHPDALEGPSAFIEKRDPVWTI